MARAEIMAGRGSFIESFPLFGYDLQDYDALFSEKLDLLLKLRGGLDALFPAEADGFEHYFLGKLVRPALYHRYSVYGTCYGKLKLRLDQLLRCGIQYEASVKSEHSVASLCGEVATSIGIHGYVQSEEVVTFIGTTGQNHGDKQPCPQSLQ